jgi:hypothetical protein
MSDSLRKIVDHWRPIVASMMAVAGALWIGVTTADEVIRAAKDGPLARAEVSRVAKSLDEHLAADEVYKGEVLRRQSIIIDQQNQTNELLRQIRQGME